MEFNEGQKRALEILTGNDNAFLTGQAGVGKTTVVKEFLKRQKNRYQFPVIASTGMAALLAGGRTAHSAFCIGAVTPELSDDKIVKKALEDDRIHHLRDWKGFLLDEVSMIDARTMNIMERVAREVRRDPRPWGGLRAVVVGDFAQLPPVSRENFKPWCFKSESWAKSKFKNVMLTEVMRTKDPGFLEMLNLVRRGELTQEVKMFFNSRLLKNDKGFDGTRLFGRRRDVEEYNRSRMENISGDFMEFETKFFGKGAPYYLIKNNCPVGDKVSIKVGSLVMIRSNSSEGGYVNGSLGTVTGYVKGGGMRGGDAITIKLMSDGFEVSVDEYTWEIRDEEDRLLASARNFPISAAYAMTIHKTQGATLDKVLIDATEFWEAGQLYVALSRVKGTDGLYLSGWSPRSVIADKEVIKFYNSFSGGHDGEGESTIHVRSKSKAPDAKGFRAET